MGVLDDIETLILPQLVAITNLHIGETSMVIVTQRLDEEVLVLGKSIGARVVATVQIAEEDQPCVIVEQNVLGGMKGLGHPSVGTGA